MMRVDQNSKLDSALSKGALSILGAAVPLFAEKGFSAVSINDIALRANTSKANIFHHFKSKKGLYIAVMKSACGHFAQVLDKVELVDNDSPQKKLETFFTLHLQSLQAHPQSARLIQHELLENESQRGKHLAEEVFSKHFTRLVELVREGQSQDWLRKDFDTSLMAFVLVATNIFFFESRSVLQHLPEVNFAESPDHYNSTVFKLLLNGFQKES